MLLYLAMMTIAGHDMKPPKTLYLGYSEIKIKFTDLSDCYGQFDAETMTIEISNSTRRGGDLVATLLHEINHAIFRNMKGFNNEEQIVSILANHYTELFKRNPKLLKWMREELDND